MKNQTNLNCNIIKDLLPSYMENICSQETKNAVEMHLSVCSKCKATVEMMRETDIVSEDTERIEIDYMKKLKRHFIKKGSLGGIVMSSFVLLGLVVTIRDFTLYPPTLYYIILALLLIATKALVPSTGSNHKKKIKQKIFVSIGIILTCYSMAITHICIQNARQWVVEDSWPFHLKAEDVGPLIFNQYLIIIVYLAAMYIMEALRTMHGKQASFYCMGIYLTCGFVILNEMTYLRTLSDYATLCFSMKISAMLLIEGILILILFTVLEKINAKYKLFTKKSCR